MGMDKKKRDALGCIMWAGLSVANLVALLLTRDDTYGFIMLFCLIWFLNEDREFKRKYGEMNRKPNEQ